MADLNEAQASGSTKLVGSDSSGGESFYAQVTSDGRLLVEAIVLETQIKVSSDDQSQGYLEAKIVGKSGETVATTLNPGSVETLEISLANAGTAGTYGSASQVPVLTTDAKGRVTAVTNTSISISSGAVTDFTEAAQDAVGAALTDSASIDFTYNDGANTITAAVLPAGVDHNSLANLTAGDPHTQYVKDAGTVTDNAIVRYDGTDGRTIQNSAASVDDNGAVIAGGFIRPADTSDTTNGNIRYTATNTEFLARENGTWKNITITPTEVNSDVNASTTSATFSTISGMTITPAAGTYLVYFSSDAHLTGDATTTGEVVIRVGGTQVPHSLRNCVINFSATLLKFTELAFCVHTQCIATVNGSQAIDMQFRETSGGTFTIEQRSLVVIPISR